MNLSAGLQNKSVPAVFETFEQEIGDDGKVRVGRWEGGGVGVGFSVSKLIRCCCCFYQWSIKG